MKKLTLNQILVLVLAFLLLSIIAVSAIALCNKNLKPGAGLRKEDPAPKSISSAKSAFNSIGQIRTFTKEESEDEKTVIVLIPWFEYDGTDTAFYEELDRKHQSLKAIITSYFTSHTKTELLNLGEDKIKLELRERVNSMLILGKIDKIYFNDYIFLD